MGDVNCSICLENLRQPVSIPCGHLHCEKCLSSHIRSGQDPLRSNCPTCRAQFYTASLDLAYVPKKYHDFILPSVRRIYLDTSHSDRDDLLHEIERLKARSSNLESTKSQLMDRCEALQCSVGAHSEGERKARVEADKARVEAVKARGDVDKAREEVSRLNEELDSMQGELEETRSERDVFRRKYETYKGKYTTLKESNARQPEIGTKRKNNSTRADFPLSASSYNYATSSSDLSPTSSVLDSPPSAPRSKRPLPRVRVVSTGSDDDKSLDAPPVFKRSRIAPMIVDDLQQQQQQQQHRSQPKGNLIRTPTNPQRPSPFTTSMGSSDEARLKRFMMTVPQYSHEDTRAAWEETRGDTKQAEKLLENRYRAKYQPTRVFSRPNARPVVPTSPVAFRESQGHTTDLDDEDEEAFLEDEHQHTARARTIEAVRHFRASRIR